MVLSYQLLESVEQKKKKNKGKRKSDTDGYG